MGLLSLQRGIPDLQKPRFAVVQGRALDREAAFPLEPAHLILTPIVDRAPNGPYSREIGQA